MLAPFSDEKQKNIECHEKADKQHRSANYHI